MTPLGQILARQIDTDGPLSLSDYMAQCLGHPAHGYYMARDPFGPKGDFTTAPEISQLFGEMIAAWLVDGWRQMGAPDPFILLECGPGRGTLMSDILRIAKLDPAFLKAAKIYLLETSPALQARQRETLADYNVHHIETVEALPDMGPVLVIGNEFLDALPIDQYVFKNGQWQARQIAFQDDGFVWRMKESNFKLPPGCDEKPSQQDVFEDPVIINSFLDVLAPKIKAQGGLMLFIDYGLLEAIYGDTLQAVRQHQYVAALEMQGEADLTVHVNFARLGQGLKAQGLHVFGATEQASFLKRLGIDIRLQQLLGAANNDKQKETLLSGYERIIATQKETDMGRLFKVIAAGSNPDLQLAGFN